MLSYKEIINVIGFFNGDGNHDLKFGPYSRRLYGPVYIVCKYKSSVIGIESSYTAVYIKV
jgi:hypothetical protein